MKRSRESSSTQSTSTSNPKQKRGRIESEHAEQEVTKRAEEAGLALQHRMLELLEPATRSSL